MANVVINGKWIGKDDIEGIKKIAREMKDKVAGRADGDELTGMNRLYN